MILGRLAPVFVDVGKIAFQGQTVKLPGFFSGTWRVHEICKEFYPRVCGDWKGSESKAWKRESKAFLVENKTYIP